MRWNFFGKHRQPISRSVGRLLGGVSFTTAQTYTHALARTHAHTPSLRIASHQIAAHPPQRPGVAAAAAMVARDVSERCVWIFVHLCFEQSAAHSVARHSHCYSYGGFWKHDYVEMLKELFSSSPISSHLCLRKVNVIYGCQKARQKIRLSGKLQINAYTSEEQL